MTSEKKQRRLAPSAGSTRTQSPLEALNSPPVLPAAIVTRSGKASVKGAISPFPTGTARQQSEVKRPVTTSQSPSVLHDSSTPLTTGPTVDPNVDRDTPLGPKRYDGFPGVPAYVLAPDIIVFTPRRVTSPPLQQRQKAEAAPSRPDGGSSAHVPTATIPRRAVLSPNAPQSLTIESSERDLEEPSRGFSFTHIWVLCSVVVGTFILPAGLLILSYFSTPSMHGNSTPEIIPTGSHRYALPPEPITSGKAPSLHLPAECTASPQINVKSSNTSFDAAGNPNAGAPMHTIFCVFNVTRFWPSSGSVIKKGYAPRNMPLEFCQRFVYWSMSVAQNKLKSRAPQFESEYGIQKLRQLVNGSSRQGKSSLLLAFGGYQSDSVRLTLMAWDQRQFALFVRDVLDTVRNNLLDGVTVHWVRPGSDCRDLARNDDVRTMSAVVRGISQVFELNGLRPGLITLLLPAEHSTTAPLVNALIDRVDFVLVETHLLPPSPSLEFCVQLAKATIDFIVSLALSAEQSHKVCTGYSLSPWKVMASLDASRATKFVRFDTDSQLPGLPARGATSDLCQDNRKPCRMALVNCFGVATDRPALGSQFSAYLFHTRKVVRTIFAHSPNLATTDDVIATDWCGAVYDLDLDNRIECAGFNETYRYLRHLNNSLGSPSYLSGLETLLVC